MTTSASRPRAVLVTGASTGIGRACALLLSRKGFRVFATVRTQHDADDLKSAEEQTIVPIELDVTEASTIARAAERIADETGGEVFALVNNAGIGLSGPLEYADIDSVRKVFDVNVLGQVAVTQAFLPMIRACRGRVLFVGSVAAHMAIPFGGVLCASKGAVSLLSDALRMELRPFGIHVCLIEPGAICTPAVDKTLGDVEGLIRSLPVQGARRYAAMLRTFTERALLRERNGSPPETVARVVLEALTVRHPRTRYAVGTNAKPLLALSKWLPNRLLDRVRLRIFRLPSAFGALVSDGLPPSSENAAHAGPRADLPA